MTTIVITYHSGVPAEQVAQFLLAGLERIAKNVQIEITEGLNHESPEKPVGVH